MERSKHIENYRNAVEGQIVQLECEISYFESEMKELTKDQKPREGELKLHLSAMKDKVKELKKKLEFIK